MYRINCRIMLLFVLFIWMLSINICYGESVPQIINYQGTLTDTLGNPVADGQYGVVFSIYDVATGGTALWTETWNNTTVPITVIKGNFNALLGTHASIPLSFFNDHPVTYLGIKVGNDSEMLPRQRISSVAYAFTAGTGVPKGAIILWSGALNQIPEGWALCDGTNGTPNLRDRFVVGAGSGYSVGATGGEATHALTINEIPSHNHGGITSGQSANHTHSGTLTSVNRDGTSGTRVREADPSGTYGGVAYVTGSANNDHAHVISSQGGGVGHENRPPYYALAFIMKL